MESNGLPDTIAGYVDAVRNGRISVPDAIDVFLDRIRRLDNKIHAFLHVMVEAARKRARAIQEQIDGGHWPGPLAVASNVRPVAGLPYLEYSPHFQ